MNFRLSFSLIIISLLIAAVAPAFHEVGAAASQSATSSGTVKLIINNKTKETVKLNLKGPDSYEFTVKPGKVSVDVKAGIYKYSYKACKIKQSGTINASRSGVVLTLPACKGKDQPPEMVRILFHNETHAQVHIRLVGPAQYDFYLNPGKTTKTIIAGKYDYTAWGCGTTIKGKLKFLKHRELWLHCYRRWR